MSTTVAGRAWLEIANGGGRWSVPEIRARLQEENTKTVENTVAWLGDAGFLQVYEPCDGYPYQRYGVTAGCHVPRGVMNWEVLEAMGLQLRPGLNEEAVARGMTVGDVIRAMGTTEAAA